MGIALLLVVGENEDVFVRTAFQKSLERKIIHVVWLQLSMQTDLEKKDAEIVLKIQFVSV